MSFGVLGCLLPGLIITEKECVEKTYPEYWDHLRLHLGATLAPASSHPGESPAPFLAIVSFARHVLDQACSRLSMGIISMRWTHSFVLLRYSVELWRAMIENQDHLRKLDALIHMTLIFT